MIRRAYYWEVRKLAAQRRTYLGLVLAALVPVGFAIGLKASPPSRIPHGTDPDVIFGSYVAVTGVALPLQTLVFAALLLLPAVAALVAADIVANEHEHGTLKSILTRGVSRSDIFAAKAAATATYVFVALLLFTIVGLVAGAVTFGIHDLPTTPPLAPLTAMLYVIAAVGVFALPLLAVTSFGLLFSTLFRNSASAIIAMLALAFALQIITFIPGISHAIERVLLARQFDAWQAVGKGHINARPLLECAAVSLVYAATPLLVAWRRFTSQDVLD